MKSLALVLIRLYKTFVSPYKGYRCAHATFYRADSCSTAVQKIITRRGIIKGWPAIQQQQKKRRRQRNKDNKNNDCCNIELPCETGNCLLTKCKANKPQLPDIGCDNLPCDCSF